ncbi:MAG: hypothetical protein AB7O84_24675, partial [Planctomycetota bacterium]
LRGGSVRALVAPVPGGLLDGRSDPGSVRLHTVGMDPAAVPVVALVGNPLEGLFAGNETLRLQERDDLEEALLRATAAPLRAVAGEWEHDLELDLLRRRVHLLVRGRLSGTPEVAVAGPDGPWGIALDPATVLALAERLDAATSRTLANRGLALGDSGLHALPDDVRRLRLWRVSAAMVATIDRFASVRTVDLRDAPEWHDADVLRWLARALPLRSLTLDGSRLDRAGVAALAGFSGLQELFLIAPGQWQIPALAQPPLAQPSPALDDAAVGALAQLPELRELVLGGAALGDRGLAALAALPKLRALALVECPLVTGAGLGAFAGHPLERLVLADCHGFDARGLSALAGLRALRELTVAGARGGFDLRPLASLPALDAVRLLGAVDAADLGALCELPGLRRLTLRPDRRLDAAELARLHGLRHVESIELAVGRAGVNAPDPAAIDALRAALPDARIGVDDW